MALRSFCNLPDPLSYLNDAKVLLSPDKSRLRLFLRDVDRLAHYMRSNDTSCAHSLIYTIANYLRFAPRLLYGLNTIIRPCFRLECVTSTSQVNHYVLADGVDASIYSFNPNPHLPSSLAHVRDLVESKDGWNRVLEAKPDDEWLACLAQIVQEILDDPTTSASVLPTAHKRLIRLSKLGIIPPSIFVHFPAMVKPSDYMKTLEYIASGGSCDVYKFDNENTSICFRVLRQPEASPSEKLKFRADFCKEVVVWRQLRHPNILNFIGVTGEIYARRNCFVLPWLFHGSIVSYLRKHPEHDKLVSVGQIIDAVYYLHNLNPPVSHKDIKGANILVRNDLVCVLTDFGLSNILDSQRSRDSGCKGTFYWMAPEMFHLDVLDPDARPRDIYALGCTIYEIYAGRSPSMIMRATVHGKNPTLPPKNRSWTEEEIDLWGFVGMCLNPNPEDRPNIKLLRDAIWDVRNWAISPFPPTESESETATPTDFDKVQDWLKQEQLDLIQNPDIRYEVPRGERFGRQMPATFKARGLYTPNTPNYRSLPDLESLEANFPVSQTFVRSLSLTHTMATTPELSRTQTPFMPTPPLTPRPVTTARPNRSVLRHRYHADFTATLLRSRLKRT